jgi:hypothetical protein
MELFWQLQVYVIQTLFCEELEVPWLKFMRQAVCLSLMEWQRSCGLYTCFPNFSVLKNFVLYSRLYRSESVRACVGEYVRVTSLQQFYGDGWPTQLLHTPIYWRMFPACVFTLHIAWDTFYYIGEDLIFQSIMSQTGAFGAYGGGERCAQGVGGEAKGKEATGETQT